jgi:murein DD-endopeptidase MepM/ murein hydrolase activator NlpD
MLSLSLHSSFAPLNKAQGFCAPEKTMFVISSSSVKKQLLQLKWPAVAAGVLTAWLAASAVMAAQQRVQASPEAASSTEQDPAFLPMPEKTWLSHVNVSRRAQAAIADSHEGPSAGPGAYFRVLARIYGASIEVPEREQIDEVAQHVDEPMPLDEVAKFHQMETHMPVALARITSQFGRRPNPLGKGHVFHRGIDLAAPTGAPVHAVAAGTVIKATYDRSYGYVVVINHHNGYKTLYAHASKLLVKAGQKVKAGQQIAKVGSTGHSTGPHLHFEIHRSGQRVDPGPYLAAL